MQSLESKQFEVSLASMKIAPYVGPKGNFARAVQFRVRSLDSLRTERVDGGLVGEETLRRCELLKQRGPETVTVTSAWTMQHGLIDIVNIALENLERVEP